MIKKQGVLRPSLISVLLSVGLTIGASVGHAAEAGDNVVTVGMTYFAMQEDSGDIKFSGLPTGSEAVVSNSSTLAATYLHYFTDNIAGEMVAGIPPKFTITTKGGLLSVFGVNKIGTTRAWPVMAMGRYEFGTKQDKFRPYMGLGAVYLFFKNNTIDKNLSTNYPGGSGYTFEHKLKSDMKPIIAVGGNYAINNRLSLSASVMYSPLKTSSTLTATPPSSSVLKPAVTQVDVKLNPVVGNILFNYKL